MTGRENYNDLYVFMLVAREGSFTKQQACLVWLNLVSAAQYAIWKIVWACNS